MFWLFCTTRNVENTIERLVDFEILMCFIRKLRWLKNNALQKTEPRCVHGAVIDYTQKSEAKIHRCLTLFLYAISSPSLTLLIILLRNASSFSLSFGIST